MRSLELGPGGVKCGTSRNNFVDSHSRWLTKERAAGDKAPFSLSSGLSSSPQLSRSRVLKNLITVKTHGRRLANSRGTEWQRWAVTGVARLLGLVSPLSWGHWCKWCSGRPPLGPGHAVSPPPLLQRRYGLPGAGHTSLVSGPLGTPRRSDSVMGNTSMAIGGFRDRPGSMPSK